MDKDELEKCVLCDTLNMESDGTYCNNEWICLKCERQTQNKR